MFRNQRKTASAAGLMMLSINEMAGALKGKWGARN